jgi:hypothetical protein
MTRSLLDCRALRRVRGTRPATRIASPESRAAGVLARSGSDVADSIRYQSSSKSGATGASRARIVYLNGSCDRCPVWESRYGTVLRPPAALRPEQNRFNRTAV